jgi:hypothetical protein
MKIILVIVLILTSFMAYSQIEWAPIGAKWYISKMEGTMPPNEGYILYEVKKDTLIHDQKVRMISKTYFHSNGKDVTAGENEYTYEKDSVVYYWKNGHFYTLYDFSARKGDKWTVYGTASYKDYCGYDSLGVVVVDSVTTLTINNQKLRAIYTSPDIGSNWRFKGVILERVGNITHLLPKSEGCLLDIPDDEGSLRCYEDNSLWLYKTGYCRLVDCICNELKNYTSVNSISNNSLLKYPNPVKNYLKIHQDNDLSNNLIATEIYDMKGEKIITYENADNLYVGFLKRGLYIVKLSYKDHNSLLKIIKE